MAKPSLTNISLWWEVGNSIYIWITIALLLGLLFSTSWDPAHPTQFMFGENQIFILGFITVLLLFRYISKIKIGPVEIEFKVIEDKLEAASQKLNAVNVAQLTATEKTEFSNALRIISDAKALVGLMRQRFS